jgi:hypothetical protein
MLQSRMAATLLVLLVGLVGLASAHEIYPGKCPEFTPMENFKWDKVMFRPKL